MGGPESSGEGEDSEDEEDEVSGQPGFSVTRLPRMSILALVVGVAGAGFFL